MNAATTLTTPLTALSAGDWFNLFLYYLSLSLLAVVYAQFASHPAVAGALRGMGAVAAGLIAGVAIKLFSSIKSHPLGRPLCVAVLALTIVAMVVLRWPLWWILPVIGGAACLLTWRKLAP